MVPVAVDVTVSVLGVAPVNTLSLPYPIIDPDTPIHGRNPAPAPRWHSDRVFAYSVRQYLLPHDGHAVRAVPRDAGLPQLIVALHGTLMTEMADA